MTPPKLRPATLADLVGSVGIDGPDFYVTIPELGMIDAPCFTTGLIALGHGRGIIHNMVTRHEYRISKFNETSRKWAIVEVMTTIDQIKVEDE